MIGKQGRVTGRIAPGLAQARGIAEAEARKARGLANAEARRAEGLAEAEAARALGLAEADAIKARGDALAENQEAVITQQLVTQLPMVVAAGAKSFENVEHMVLLDGADGVSDVFSKALTMGGTGLGLARQMLATMGDQALRRTLPEQNGAAADRSQQEQQHPETHQNHQDHPPHKDRVLDQRVGAVFSFGGSDETAGGE